MTDLDRIVESDAAARRFVERGVPSAEYLLEAIREKKHEATGRLENILLEIRDPTLVALYAPLLAGEDLERSDDVLLGLRLLAGTRDPSAVPHLVRYLSTKERFWRDRAASALAEMALAEAREPLLSYADELLEDRGSLGALADRCAREWEMRPLRALIDVAVGLARLGDQQLAFVPIELATHAWPPRTDRFEQLAIRIEASHALRHVVGSGLVAAIDACVRGREIETARNGAFAAFLVGTADVIPILLAAGKRRDHELRNNAPIWLHRLLANDADYEEMTPAARARWVRPIPPGVVYRCGHARDEREVIELLRSEHARDAFEELSITLGEMPASRLIDVREQKEELHARAVARAQRFPATPGALRRHGREFAVPS
jgi:hypothetical protein